MDHGTCFRDRVGSGSSLRNCQMVRRHCDLCAIDGRNGLKEPLPVATPKPALML